MRVDSGDCAAPTTREAVIRVRDTGIGISRQMLSRLFESFIRIANVMAIETVYRGHADTRQYDFARGQLAAAMTLLGPGPADRQADVSGPGVRP